MTNRQFRIELTQCHFQGNGLRSLIEEAAVGRPFVRIGYRAVKISFRRAIDKCLDAGRICGCSDKEPIASIGDTEGIFVRRT